MLHYDPKSSSIVGPSGSLQIARNDRASLKMAMLLEGECTEVGPVRAAANFNYSKARYFQIRHAFSIEGMDALICKKTGPKTNYRRTSTIIKLVIRARFLDPDTTAEVITSKLTQDCHKISIRSVKRIICDYGLQKKTSHSVPLPGSSHDPDTTYKE